MKKLFFTVSIWAIGIMICQPCMAQNAVNDALSQAEKVSFESNKKQLKNEQKALKNIYAKALKEIEAQKAAALKKPENYAQLAEECHLWADLQTRMERLAAEGKWNTPIEHINYDSLTNDICQKAAKYHYEKGRKMCENGKKWEQKQAGLAMMQKAVRYDSTFATVALLYRDSIELPYAYTLAQSNKENDQIEALRLFDAIIARHKGDSTMQTRIMPDRTRIQKQFYEKAEALFAKEKYQAQYDAAHYYAVAGDFRDATTKEKLARKRGVLSVAVINTTGNTAARLDTKTLAALQEAFPKYFDFESMQGLTTEELQEKQCALAFAYNDTLFGHYQYAHNRTEMDKNIVKFMHRSIKDGIASEKEISEKEYNKGKAQDSGTELFNMYQGKLHRTRIESVMDIDYTFDVTDLRDSTHTVGKIEKAGKYRISEIGTEIVTYEGDEQSRPNDKELINRDKKMTDKELVDLAEEKKIYGWTMVEFLQKKAKDIAKEVVPMLPYRHFTK